jgi:hypothetical protein
VPRIIEPTQDILPASRANTPLLQTSQRFCNGRKTCHKSHSSSRQRPDNQYTYSPVPSPPPVWMWTRMIIAEDTPRCPRDRAARLTLTLDPAAETPARLIKQPKDCDLAVDSQPPSPELAEVECRRSMCMNCTEHNKRRVACRAEYSPTPRAGTQNRCPTHIYTKTVTTPDITQVDWVRCGDLLREGHRHMLLQRQCQTRPSTWILCSHPLAIVKRLLSCISSAC